MTAVTRQTPAQLDQHSRPVAALAVGPEDLPDVAWQDDEASATRFGVVEIGGRTFVLEWEAEASDKQTTVYGPATSGALDALLERLGLSERNVLDRVDGSHGPPAVDGLQQAVREQVQTAAAGLRARLMEIEARTARLEEDRKQAAAALVEGGDSLTERKRQILSLFVSGMTADEVAQVLDISRETVLRHRRNAVKHRSRSLPRTGVEALTVRERQVGSLAAEGLSNREIAEALVVTVKTVEWHLKHTYRKLGVTSREEIADSLRNVA